MEVFDIVTACIFREFKSFKNFKLFESHFELQSEDVNDIDDHKLFKVDEDRFRNNGFIGGWG